MVNTGKGGAGFGNPSGGNVGFGKHDAPGQNFAAPATSIAPAAPPPVVSDKVDPSLLTEEDKAAFLAVEFEYGKVPEVPPPPEYCS